MALCLQGPGFDQALGRSKRWATSDEAGVRDPGPGSEEQVSPWARLLLNRVACLSLFTEPSEPFPEEPKAVEMPSHHCHRDPLPQLGLTPERLQAQRQLCAACAVCCVFMAGEVVGKLRAAPPTASSCNLPVPLSTQHPRDAPGWRYREDGDGWDGEVGCSGLQRWERVRDSKQQGEFTARSRARGPGLASQC